MTLNNLIKFKYPKKIEKHYWNQLIAIKSLDYISTRVLSTKINFGLQILDECVWIQNDLRDILNRGRLRKIETE